MKGFGALTATLGLIAFGTIAATVIGLWRWATRYESIIRNQNNER
ncbi:hypothetical protein QM716_01070 [Rhodococcus sp. IEGM 1409]|nr:hypothetical protein [Rhodococcus sp. IEGM 1409]MDI9898438.1 hypothetical protein [Rhodococcus sp. IEGM 1409]